MLFFVLLFLIHQSFAACDLSLLQADILQNCLFADASRACPPPCQVSVQAANACKPLDQGLSAIVQIYSFCKPPVAKCRLVVKQESCIGSCQWCHNKCQASDVKCQLLQCASLQQARCKDQCEWCESSQTCAILKQCSRSSKCQDDPVGTLASFGYTCSLLLEVTSNKCDFDLTGIDASLKGVTPAKLCPNACSRCPSQVASSSGNTPVCQDDPDGLVAAQGFDCTTILQVTANNCDFDLSTLSPAVPQGTTPGQLCPQSCQRCEGQTRTAVSNSPIENASDGGCKDDPEGLVAQQGLTCKSIMEYATNDCDLDLNSLNPDVPKGLTPSRLCPQSCKKCKQAVSAACVDDPTGMVAQHGFNCATILGVTGNDCSKDLSTLSADIPKGVTPNQLCPKSCARCKDSDGNFASLPPKTADTFINGHRMTSTQRSWLEGLGVKFPPGRYFIRPDGSAGLEGGPPLLNVYVTAGQKVDTVITQAMRDSGIERTAIKTRDEVHNAIQWTKTAGRTAGQSVTQASSATKTGFRNFISQMSNFFGG